MLEFFKQFPNFTKMTGLEEAALATEHNTAGFMIKYFYLISTYPVIEQLIKMGYWSIFIETIRACNASSKKERIAFVKSLSKVIDENATSGKKGFKLPSYISNYISQISANLTEVIAWKHLHESVNFSKESFLALVESSYFKLIELKINRTILIQDLAKIAVFGYEPVKTINYIVKQAHRYSRNISTCFNDLCDYARMCDVMGVAPDLYPKDIKEVHDSMTVQFQAYKNAALDDNIKAAKEKLLPALAAMKEFKTYENSEYEIVIPGSSFDIIKEGQQQRNCVGSYVRNVAEGKSIVFFIRERESIDESLVTAEYRNGILSQCYYAANRYVPEDAEERKLALMFVNELKRRGIKTA
jgi:hypothetical protein